MSRLMIHVEGEAEETFVREVLAPHLYGHGYTKVSARLIGNSRLRERRGGIRGWNTVRKDILNHLKEDPACLVTTMVDYYALPQTNEKAWPGRAVANGLPFLNKATAVETALANDIRENFVGNYDERRFIPFVVMHEFEGLLFSDCIKFGEGIGRLDLSQRFQEIRNEFNSPEEINDSPITAPSKRIKNLIPNYEKPLFGSLAILEIGLNTIRIECPHFREWLNKLETWN